MEDPAHGENSGIESSDSPCKPCNPGVTILHQGTMKKAAIIVAVLIIVGGTALLLNNLRVLPEVDWMWTGWLSACGILFLTMGGMNKVSCVLGPFLLAVAVLDVLNRTEQISRSVQIPSLVIIFGALLLLAVVSPVPLPVALTQIEDEEKD